MIHTKAIGTIGRMWNPHPPEQFVDSLVEMLAYSNKVLCGPDEFLHYVKSPVSWHESARQHLIEHMLGDWILMLDTDHVFAPDLLERLLRLRKKYDTQVLAAIYTNKFPPHPPVANVWDTEGTGFHQLREWDWDAEIMEIGPCGGGGLLINKEVLNRVQAHFGGCFNTIPGLSEDYSFFWRCREIGIKTHLALNVEVHHILPSQVSSVAGYRGQNATMVITPCEEVQASNVPLPGGPDGATYSAD